MLLGFIRVSSQEENSIPVSPQNRFGCKRCSSWHGASPKPWWGLSQSTASTPSGKSLVDKHTRRTGIWVFNFLWEALYATSLLGNSSCGSCRGDAVSCWKVTCTCRQVTFISIVSVSLHLCVSILLVFSSYRRTLKCKASQRSWKSLAFPRKGRRGCWEAVGRGWYTALWDKIASLRKCSLLYLYHVTYCGLMLIT